MSSRSSSGDERSCLHYGERQMFDRLLASRTGQTDSLSYTKIMATSKYKMIGEAVSRIDGILKVTGAANYATDWPMRNLAYGYILKSTIAAGTITDIDSSAAEKSPGVIAFISYKNAPKVTPSGNLRGGALLQDQKVEFYGQHIGVVIAETYEQARYAARLVKVTYQQTELKTDFERLEKDAVKPRDRN